LQILYVYILKINISFHYDKIDIIKF